MLDDACMENAVLQEDNATDMTDTNIFVHYVDVNTFDYVDADIYDPPQCSSLDFSESD